MAGLEISRNLKGFKAVPVPGGETPEAEEMHSFLPDQVPRIDGPPSGQTPPADAPQIGPDQEPLVLPDHKGTLEDTYGLVAKTDPERAAKVLSISQRIREPEAFVDKHLDNIQQVMNAPSGSFLKGLEDKYPGTAQWLQDPKNMAVAKDDLQNLSTHEALVQGIGAVSSLGDAFTSGWQNSIAGLYARGRTPDTQLGPNASMMQDLVSQGTSLALDFPLMVAGGIAGTVAGSAAGTLGGAAVGTAVEPGLGTLAGAGGGAAVGGVAGAAAGSFAIPAAIRQALLLHIQKGDIQSASDLMGRVYDISLESLKQGAVGLLTAGAGTAGKLFQKPAAALAAKLIAETATMTTAGKLVEGETPTAKDFVEGAITVGAMHAALSGAQKVIASRVEEKKTEAAKEFYTALGNTAEASKLRERLPEKYKELVQSITKDGPVENVFIPVEQVDAYFQSKNIDPSRMMEELGAKDSYTEAAQTGGDVRIPLADFVHKLVGSEHYAGLADDVKFSPDDLTQRQLNDRVAEVEAKVQAAQKEAVNPTPAEPGSESQVLSNITDQLKGAGFSETTAKTYGKLYEAAFRTLGENTGEDPLALFNRYQLKIKTPDTPESAQATTSMESATSQFLGEKPDQTSLNQGQARPNLKDNQGVLYKGQPIPKNLDFYKGSEKQRAQNLALGWIREAGGRDEAAAKVRELMAAREKSGQSTAQLQPVLDAVLGVKPEDVAVKPVSELFQGEGDENARGRISFGKDRQFTIDLFKSHDLSTFLHESGHFYMEVMADLANKDGAPEQIKKDYATVLKWLGVESRDQVQTEHHEKWARAFEGYLMKGEAPTNALRGVFRRLARWLTSVYKNIRALNVEVTPEISEVMSRLLATQEEIDHAEGVAGYDQNLVKNLDPKIADRLADYQDRAREAAQSEMLKQQMHEISQKHKDFLKSERTRLTTEAEAQVKQQPIFAAEKALEFHAGLGKVEGLAEKFLTGKVKDSVKAAFETIAEQHDFGSGEDMARHILAGKQADLFNREVQARVNLGMAPHANLMDTAGIRDEAIRAIHNEKMVDLLALEHQILRDQVKDAQFKSEVSKRRRVIASVSAKAAKDQARQILSDKPIKDATNPRAYVTAERNAAVKSAKAIAKKDWETAAKYKEQQLLNNALAAEANRNKTETNKILSRLDDMSKRGRDLLDMPYAFTRQVDALLSKFGLAQSRGEDQASLVKTAQAMLAKDEDADKIANVTGYVQDPQGKWVSEGLPQFVERVNENYYGLSIPESVLSAGKSVQEMSLKELRDLGLSVKSIVEVGKTYEKFLNAFIKADMLAAAKEFKASVEKNFGSPMADQLTPGRTKATKLGEVLESITSLPAAFDRSLDTVLTTCEKFDGQKEGPAKNYIYRPIAEAENRRLARTRVAIQEVEELFKNHYSPDEFASYKTNRISVDGKFFTKEEILSMALNWGNEGNRDVMMRGFGFDQTKMQRIFQNLGKRDWEFCQATWDHINKYWPEIMTLEKDVAGVEPRKIEASEFTNEHGTFSGGYYPIAYDAMKSADAYRNIEAKTGEYKQFSTAKAATEQGHAEARVNNVNRPIRLGLGVLIEHHENVIHDLEFRRAIVDVSRFLNQKDTRAAITNAVGVKGYTSIGDWLKAVASKPSEPLSMGEKAARWLRFKTTFYMLGFRLVSAPKIALENIVNVSNELGMSGASRALTGYWFSGENSHDRVISKSEFMKARATHLDRDLADIQKKWSGESESSFKRYAFFVHAYLDQSISFPLWADAYKRGLADHGVERRAIHEADEAVKRTFMTGSAIDQSNLMRGGEKSKLISMAYSYKSMMWNRFSQARYRAGAQWAQGNPTASLAIMARATTYTFLMPAAIAAISREFMRNNQNSNPDDQKKRMIETFLEEGTPLGFVPIARDIAPYFIKKSLGEKGSDHLSLTPLEESLSTLLDPQAELISAAIKGNQIPDKFLEKEANALSLVFGVPKQMDDTVFNFLDWQHNNGELTWRDLISRRTKK